MLALLLLGGCNVSAWANVVVLAVTLGIFCGTLALGRRLPVADDTGQTSSEDADT